MSGIQGGMVLSVIVGNVSIATNGMMTVRVQHAITVMRDSLVINKDAATVYVGDAIDVGMRTITIAVVVPR